MIKHLFLRYFFTSILIVSIAVCSFGQIEKAEADIKEIMKNLDVVGLSVAVVKDGGIISASDLAKYMIMHMNKGVYEGVRIISKRSAKLMQKKVARRRLWFGY